MSIFFHSVYLALGDTQIEQQTAFPDEEGVLLLFLRKRERNFTSFPYSRMDEAGSITLVC